MKISLLCSSHPTFSEPLREGSVSSLFPYSHPRSTSRSCVREVYGYHWENKQMGLKFLEHPCIGIFLLLRIDEIIKYDHYFKQSMTIKVTETPAVRYLPISFRNDKTMENMQIPFLFRIFLIYLYIYRAIAIFTVGLLYP